MLWPKILLMRICLTYFTTVTDICIQVYWKHAFVMVQTESACVRYSAGPHWIEFGMSTNTLQLSNGLTN
jgi:hypothetical protein